MSLLRIILLVCLLAYSQSKIFTQELPRVSTGIPLKEDSLQAKKILEQFPNLVYRWPDSTIALMQEALTLSKRSQYKTGIVTSYLYTGLCLIEEMDFRLSRRYLDSAYFYCLTLPPPVGSIQMTEVLNGIGILSAAQGDNLTAIQCFHRALQQLEQADERNPALFFDLYSNIGAAYGQMKELTKALYYLKKGERLAAAACDGRKKALINSSLAWVYQDQRKYAKAEHYFKEAISYYKTQSLNAQIQRAYYGLGRGYLNQKKYDKALHYYSLAIAEDTLAAQRTTHLYQGLGDVYFNLGNYDKAEKLHKKALAVCGQQNLLSAKLHTYSSLANIYASAKRFRLAHQYRSAYANLSDSLNSIKRINLSSQLDVKYRLAEKNREITQKQLQLERQQSRLREKNFWIAGICIGALLLSVLLLSAYRNSQRKSYLHQLTVESLRKEKELGALKARMKGEEEERVRVARDLHDGVMVQFAAVKMNLSVLPEQYGDLKNAADFHKVIQNLDEAIRELRRTAHNLLPDVLLEGGLAEAVFYFLKEIEQYTGLKMEFQQYVDLPRLPPEIELSLYRIVQELVQNVIKHATASVVIVQLSYTDHLLNITVEDDGKGFDLNSIADEHKGIGLNNIRSRIVALKGQIDVQSQPGKGTAIYLELDTRLYR